MEQFNSDPMVVLSHVKKILLVDWPNKNLPGNLILAGFTVYGYSPGKYKRVRIADNSAVTVDHTNQNIPYVYDENLQLSFEPMEEQPDHVDLVCIYRPDEEIEEITQKHILPMQARIMWIQPPAHSSIAPILARKYDLFLVQDIDLAELAIHFIRSKD